MNFAGFCTIKLLQARDSKAIANLLKKSSKAYAQFFHPFPFEENTIRRIFRSAPKDLFVGLVVKKNGRDELAGIYMLRGFSEGYRIPMYGVFVGERYAGLGLARLSLQHAENFCRLNKIRELKLKVHPKNTRAKLLYKRLGFKAIGIDQSNANVILSKKLEIRRT